MARNIDSSFYTIDYRILAAVWWYESDKTRNAMMSLRLKLQERFDEDSPDGRVIKTWAEKLFQTGTINDKVRIGRPNERGDEVDRINEAITANPTTSTRTLSAELDLPRTTVQRVLKKDLHLKSFKPTKVQFLKPEDYENRVRCCNLIVNKYDNERLKNKIFFSDECAIYLTQKPYNLTMWSNENPHFWEQVHHYQPKIMIWAAMSASHLIGPFFIDGRVDANRYQQMLQDEFIPELQRRQLICSCHFQQDGAPPHTAETTRNFLNHHLHDRWVGKFGPTPWPPRSPDLTSCDNALWGIVKKNVRRQKPNTVAEIRDAVNVAFEEFSVETLRKIHL